MNRNNEKCNQNGGQPSLKNTKNVLENKEKDKVCRDYVWGKCVRAQCKLPHECDIQTMLDILQFCHDYQNSTGCKRPNCTFLHVTREEEKLFREAGQFPSDLVNRHEQMNAANMSRKCEDTYINKPTPPPLENQQAPPPMLMVNPLYQPGPRWFLQPPPPPPKEPSPPPSLFTGPPQSSASLAYPPQTLPKLSSIDTTKPPPPLLPHQIKKNGSISRMPESTDGLSHKTVSQPPPTFNATPQPQRTSLEAIDTSKPPPPLLPTQVNNNKDKRTSSETFGTSEAGPSKTRKIDSDSSTCDNCMRWELRNLLIEKKKKEKLTEKAIILLKYEEKKKEISSIIDLLRGLGIPQSDTSSSDSHDLSTLDLYAINDPENQTVSRALLAKLAESDSDFIPQFSKGPLPRSIVDILKEVEGSESARNGQSRLVNSNFDLNAVESASGLPASNQHRPPNSAAAAHAPLPPMSPQVTATSNYRPVNNHYAYFSAAGPSNGAGAMPHMNTAVIPNQHNYNHWLGRPPQNFP